MSGSSLLLGLAAALALLACPTKVDAQANTPVRTSVNPLVYANLPIFIAVDKGYFAAEKLDVDIKKFNGSSTTQMPLIARGDLDIGPMVGGPALFNQQSQGFDIKIIASLDETHEGWNDATWVIVRKDVWDAGTIRTIRDLKGHAIDGGPEGSPINFLAKQTLLKAGLTLADVTYSARLTTPPDWLIAFRNKTVEALTAVEPIATQIELQGLGVKLASAETVMPWFQEAFLVASPAFLQKSRPAAVGFLKAVLRACRDITDAGPRWTPELVQIQARWAQMAPEEIAKIKSPAYCGELGTIKEDSLARQQDFWVSTGTVQNKVAIAGIIDASPLSEARAALGIK
jgi:NitT/TauT family transport system substrate-binding protein